MRLRLIHRFFLAFAALSVAALVAFGVLQHDGFRRGFLDYLDGLSAELLETGAVRLATRYRQEGNWNFVDGRPRLLMSILGIGQEARELAGREGPGNSFAAPPPRGEPMPGNDAGLRPTGAFGPARERRDGPLRRPPPVEAPPHQRRAMDPLDIGGRLSLFDADGRIIVGNPRPPAQARAFEVRDAQGLIGHMRLAPIPNWSGALDQAFARSQWQRALIGGAAILVCALVLAWLLARWLQRPIGVLAKGARALAAGDYSMRVDSGSGDELAELAQEFNRLATTLEQHRSARRQWGADIAHELRTPLAILHGEMQALQDGVRPFGVDALASLQSETTRLTGLVEDLYQLAMSDASALEYRREILDLGVLLESVLQSHQATLRDAGLVLTWRERPAQTLRVLGDERRLHQMFGNLIANSRRYTDAPGRLEIAVHRHGTCWRVSLDDTAPGVPAEALPLLFERLYRVDASRNRASGGAGLGLSIVRSVVEAHDGQISAAHSPLGGLRIVIDLPSAETDR